MTEGGAETHERLLSTARNLYLEEGVARFSLREAARRSHISPAAVYRHFADKDALLRAVTTWGFENFQTYLMRSLGAKTPRTRLDAAARAYLAFGLENPQDYRVLFMDTAPKVGDRGETFQFLVDRVRDCIEARVIRKGDPLEIATGIWAHVHGLVSLRLSGHLGAIGSDADFARFYHHSTETLLGGLHPK